MNASKARRRWLRWCRYVQKTGSVSGNKLHAGIHAGQGNAYNDAVFARRAFPKGARYVYYPRWGVVR